MNEAVVCNAGPLVALALLDRLDLLPALFQRVIVPEVVFIEVLAGGRDGGGLGALREAAAFFELMTNPPVDPLLEAMLDAGEAAVLSCARAQGIRLVLIDEKKGRRVARTVYGLTAWGTARILVEAKCAGLIPEVRSALMELQSQGYWLGNHVIAEASRLAGE